MFAKPYDIPIDVLKVSALAGRVMDNHPRRNEILRQNRLNLAGQEGEKEVAYQLRFLPDKQFYVFHNLRLKDHNGPFQMDYAMTTTQFISPIEVKNYNGKVSANPHGEIIVRRDDGSETTYPNPVSQVERHAFQLRNWLYANDFPDIPIIPLVVFGPSSVLMDIDSLCSNVHDKVISYTNLIAKIKDISQQYPKPIYKFDMQNKLTSQLLRANIPSDLDVLKKYDVANSELKKGVLCKNCGHLPLIRTHGYWVCSKCGQKGKREHINALNDYLLLVGDTITNRQARDFLQVDEESVMRYILQNSGYEQLGNTFGTRYKLKYIKMNENARY